MQRVAKEFGLSPARNEENNDRSVSAGDRERYGLITGPAAFFQASKPPSICRVFQSGILRRLHRHRRALAEAQRIRCACHGRRQFVNTPPAAILLLQARIRRMQRAWNDAVFFALAFLAQIDNRDVRPAAQRHGFAAAAPSPCARSPLDAADLQIGRHGNVHHLRVGQFRSFISSTYSSIDLTLSRGLNASPRQWWKPYRPYSRAPDRSASSSGSFSNLLKIELYCACGSPF